MKTKKHSILDGIIAGDTATLKAFYKRNWSVILEYITKNGGTEQEAEDIFQDALLLLFKKGKLDSLLMTSASIHTYFFKICKNLWYCCLRERRALGTAKKQIKLLQRGSDLDFIRGQELMEERYNLFHEYIKRLSKTRKQLMELVAAGLCMEDIAIRMGYSEGYTRKKKFYTKKNLLEKLHRDSRYWELAK